MKKKIYKFYGGVLYKTGFVNTLMIIFIFSTVYSMHNRQWEGFRP
jgi:uncharacterized membrane protein YagU involved in acid resistance